MRILIAEDDPLVGLSIRTDLERLGHEVTAVVATGREAVVRNETEAPDLILMDIKMPDLDGIEAAAEIMRRRPVPIVLLTAYSDPELVERASAAGVVGYILKPVTPAQLLPTIRLASDRFTELTGLRKEVGTLQETLEARKVIERAKGILMVRMGLTEAQAHRRLQEHSRRHNMKLVEMAQQIIRTHELLP